MNQQALILIVDDTELNVILLNQILLNAGYRVLTANGGRKCLEILETEVPDIILLDVIMPEINGFDVAEKVKSNDKTKDIPIIFLSAVSDFDSKIKGLERGAVDYIIKPYDDREVIARIEVHLKIKALEQERLKHINELEKPCRKWIAPMAHKVKNHSRLLQNRQVTTPWKLNRWKKRHRPVSTN